MCSPSGAPKNDVIDGAPVAITIDTNVFPFKVLMIRGRAKVTTMTTIPDEYVKACFQLMGPEMAQGWFKTLEPIAPNIKYFNRIGVKPDWVNILDFTARFPSAVVKAMGGG